jgi:hypothetical protein
MFVVFGTGIFVAAVRCDWLGTVLAHFPSAQDPTMAVVDWMPLRDELRQRGLLERPGLVVGATRWLDAGKIDYALGGRVRTLCLCTDPHEYGIIAPVADYAGSDVLIIAPHTRAGEITTRFGSLFQSIEVLPPATLLHNGRPALILLLYLGHGLRSTGPGGANHS